MRIGIEAQRLFRKKKHGMDIVILELLKQIQQIDTENEYIVFVKPDKDDACLAASRNMKIELVDAPSYPIWEQFALPQAAEKANLDILHCTSNTAPLFCSVPTIVTLHDVIFMESKSAFRRGGSLYQRAGNAYRKLVVPRAIENAAHVITVSNYEQNNINRTFPYIEDKLSVIHNGVGQQFRKITDTTRLEQVRAQYNLPDRFIFFLGNTDPKKNLKRVLEAFIRYVRLSNNPMPMVIADFSPKRLTRALQDIGYPPLLHHFVLPGYIQNRDLPAIYSQCDVFLYPSLRESFGIPILEAMACGAPVITSNCTSMPEVSGDAAHLINPYDPESIVLALLRLTTDEDLRNHLSRRGASRAPLFSWRSAARKLLTRYQQFAKEGEKISSPPLAMAF